jgi:hypothetical protein
MEEDALLVLFDLRGHFAEGHNDGRGLGLREPGVLPSLRAQGMVQGLGRTGEQQPRRMGQEGRRRGAIAAQVHLDRLDGIVASAASAIEVFVQHRGGGRVQRRHDKARIIPRAHDCRLEHDPPWVLPGLGRRGELVIEAATGGRRVAVGVGYPLVMETTCRLEGGSGLPEQDGIVSKSKDTIRPAVGGDHVDDLGRRNMTIATDQNVGGRPMVAQIRQQSDPDHSIFGPRRARPWTQGGRDQGVGGPCENEERQIAMVLIVVIRAGKLLRAMCGSIGVVYIEDNGGGRLGVAGNEVVHQGLGETIDVCAVHLMLETGEGGGTR